VKSSKPTPGDIQEAIAAALARGRRSLADVAQILCVSPSTLQRSLAEQETDFTSLRREIQVRVALKHLTAGVPAWRVAQEVGLSHDHLRVIIKAATGLTPLEILTAARISATLRRWRSSGPPAYGSWLYRRQFEQWQKFDTQLQKMFEELGPAHPLANWAKEVLLAANRPDFRKQPYRDQHRRIAKRQDAQLREMLERSRSDLAAIFAASGDGT